MSTNIVAGSVSTDYETAASHTITVRETLAGASNSPRDTVLTINVTDVDDTAPTITTSATASVAENAVLAITLAANETVTWSITGGADAARFEISGTTLRWTGNGTKDFEAPNDANTDNVYIVQVTATDTASNATNKTISVTVTDVVETLTPPTIFGANLVAWYDPQDQATVFSDAGTTQITNGGTVVQVNDKSGNNRHLTAVSTSVTWHLGGMSSKSAFKITPPGGIGGLKSGLTAVAMGVSSFAAWIVAQEDRSVITGNARLLSFLGSGDANELAANSVGFFFEKGYGDVASYRDGNYLGSTAISDLTTARLSVVFDGVNQTPYTNNSVGTSAASTGSLAATGQLLVGCNSSGGNNWLTTNAAIGEIVIVKGTVTSQQRTDMQTYLAGRW